jgi:hypothetical protein
VKEFVVYTLSRLGLFAASYALVVGVYLLVSGADAVPLFWPLVVAVVISAAGSLYLLRGQRARFAAVVERRATAATRRFEEARSREDRPED